MPSLSNEISSKGRSASSKETVRSEGFSRTFCFPFMKRKSRAASSNVVTYYPCVPRTIERTNALYMLLGGRCIVDYFVLHARNVKQSLSWSLSTCNEVSASSRSAP